MQESPPEANELARAVKQARALFSYDSERITNQAFWLGLSEMIDNHHWLETYLSNLAAVTPLEVQRFAQLYLRPQNRTLGTYLPTNNDGGERQIEE